MNRLNIIIIVINICLIEAIIIFNGLRISFENTVLSLGDKQIVLVENTRFLDLKNTLESEEVLKVKKKNSKRWFIKSLVALNF